MSWSDRGVAPAEDEPQTPGSIFRPMHITSSSLTATTVVVSPALTGTATWTFTAAVTTNLIVDDKP